VQAAEAFGWTAAVFIDLVISVSSFEGQSSFIEPGDSSE
jgi:hypothetical protein